jgi:hypothetical protein
MNSLVLYIPSTLTPMNLTDRSSGRSRSSSSRSGHSRRWYIGRRAPVITSDTEECKDIVRLDRDVVVDTFSTDGLEVGSVSLACPAGKGRILLR